MERIFGIINYKKERTENALQLARKLIESNCTNEICIFTKENIDSSMLDSNIHNEIFTEDVNNRAKAKNYVLKYFYNKIDDNIEWLNILEDNIQIVSDPKLFIEKLEKTLSLLDIGVWFGTACDKCNYIYNKYSPRLDISFKDTKYLKLGITERLLFTSNANTAWTMFNKKLVSLEDCLFPEEYTIPMFYIIEHIAKRRNNKKNGQISYMNIYPTIDDEHRVYKYIDSYNVDPQLNDRKRLIEENIIFRKKNIPSKSDSNIDVVLENIYDILNNKLKKLEEKEQTYEDNN